MTTATVHSGKTMPGFRMTGKGFRSLVRNQARLLFREPGVALAGVALPIVLIVIFGNIPSFTKPSASLGGRTTLDVYIPTLAMLSSIMLALSALPTTIAELREHGVLRRLSVSPVPAAGVLAAQVTVLLAIAAFTAGAVAIIGLGVFGAAVPAHLGLVLASCVLGTTAVVSVGLLVAAVAPTTGAAAGMGIPFMFLNFFFGGLYVPVQDLGSVLKTVSGLVPFGAIVDTWSGIGQSWEHLTVLGVYTVVGAFAAARLFKWE